jgi:hypothetical protein
MPVETAAKDYCAVGITNILANYQRSHVFKEKRLDTRIEQESVECLGPGPGAKWCTRG